MKFLLDMPISPKTTDWLKKHGHDALHVRDLGMARSDDTSILKYSADQGRILLSIDLDFGALMSFSRSANPGIILFRMQRPLPELIHKRLEFIFQTHKEAELASSITIVDDSRLRIRKLPIN